MGVVKLIGLFKKFKVKPSNIPTKHEDFNCVPECFKHIISNTTVKN